MQHTQAPETPFSRFLYYANEASRLANDEQREAIRALAAQQLSHEDNIRGICIIMGW